MSAEGDLSLTTDLTDAADLTSPADLTGAAGAIGGPRPVPELEADDDFEPGDPDHYFNRELSWLEFNRRVLELAEDENVPLLERVKFCSIYASNLDEFFMVRVAGLWDQVDAGIDKLSYDGMLPRDQIAAIRERTLELDRRLDRCLQGLLVRLGAEGIEVADLTAFGDSTLRDARRVFEEQVFPALTPLVIGLGRPFPYISNLSLSLAVLLRDPEGGGEVLARVKVPKELLGRFITLDLARRRVLVPLEDLIAANLGALFPGVEVIEHGLFRVTRDADFTVSDEADDLLQAVQDELRRRRFGEVVRLEVAEAMPGRLKDALVEAMELQRLEVFEAAGMLDQADLMEIYEQPGHGSLRYETFNPVVPPRLLGEGDGRPANIFSAIRQKDILVHHPYDSFAASVERLIEHAAADPEVLAIKQTVYRTSDDSPLVPALIRASERGKQAVCMVELKARFDEQANIGWAKAMEEAGVHVVYGIPGLKTHVKALMIARREGSRVRNYVHIGTGNYHPKTARFYTDFGLLTADPEIGADVAQMFNVLTGYGRPSGYRRVVVSPRMVRERILAEVAATVAAHEAGEPARIVMKMNSLVDVASIDALYEASRAGVPIDLNVRGICCLRPGVPGLSETIRVVSVVGRFLEHSRAFAFLRGGEWRVLIGSADLMRRNLDNRVELVTPVDDPEAKAEVLDVLERCMADNTNAWRLAADGGWERLEPGDGVAPRNAQRELIDLHRGRVAELIG